ncbi:hypothetical protein LAZ67_4003449 [Cordylochernes scorpioides]|uniref:Transposase n=1 Tax=Cordylochernes scorpioides TaxID=51811 RepID=A0ABY6KDM9_9ARAC|nr:hypothetical protein LAZ67_4003449 [Cordylochernes scorpioides]
MEFLLEQLSPENNIILSEFFNIVIEHVRDKNSSNLHLKRSPTKFVPHLLTNEQKEHSKETCKSMVEMFNYYPHWFKNVITGDETWVYGFDSETNRQSSQWLEPGEPRLKKARMIKSRLSGQTIIQHYYLDVLRRLREAVRQKRLENRLLHNDNARPHTAVTVQLYLAKHGIALLPQPPYSPDLAPNDFFLYPKIKKVLKKRRFDSISEIKENLKNISKSLKDVIFRGILESGEKDGTGGHGKGKLGMGFLCYRCRIREMRLRLEIA